MRQHQGFREELEMDTIELIGNDRELRDLISENLLFEQDEDTFNGGISKKSHYLYRMYQNAKIDNALFEIKYNDKLNGNWNGFKLITHLSHHKSFNAFIEALKKLTKHRFNHVYSELKITRFDFAVDTTKDFHFIMSSISRKGVQVRKVFENKGGMKTCYIGSPRGKQIKFYDKELDQFDDSPGGAPLTEKKLGTRIEISLMGKHLPFRKLCELTQEIWTVDFFKDVFFIDSDINFFDIDNERVRDRMLAFCFCRDKYGFLEAKRIFSKNGNFHRDIQPYLAQKTNIDLTQMSINRIERMFEVQNL